MEESPTSPEQDQPERSMRIQHIIALSFYINEKDKNITKNILAADGPKLSAGASLQLQLIPAIRSAQDLGLKPAALSLHSPIRAGESLKKQKCICLVGKMSSNSEDLVKKMINANLPFIKELKSIDCPIIVQYSDNIFEEKNILSDFYSELFLLADRVVYPSNALRILTADHVPNKCGTVVIPDPWQLRSSHMSRYLNAKQECKIIWFGSAKNTPYLINCLANLLRNAPKNCCFELTILGLKISHDIIKEHIKSHITAIPSNWKIRMVTWNHLDQPQQLEQEISRAHIALIPSDPNDPRKAGVSHNRLVDAVRGGCVPIASPMESYLELKDVALLGTDMASLLTQAIQSYEQLSEKIDQKKDAILERFSPEINQQAWKKLLEDVI